MFCMVDRFSQISKAVILSFSLLAVFSGLCYGQQNNGQTTVLVSVPKQSFDTTPVTTFTGGTKSSTSGNGNVVAFTSNTGIRPAISNDLVNGNITIISSNPQPQQGLDTAQDMIGDIVFTSSTLGTGSNIFLTTPNSTTPMPITTSGGNSSPSISPNGNSIVFVSTDSLDPNIPNNTRTRNIYVSNRNGGSIKLVSTLNGKPFSTDCNSPSISDTGIVVFESAGILYVKNINDSNDPSKEINVSIKGSASQPSISADGNIISCLSTLPNPGTVNVILNAPPFKASSLSFPMVQVPTPVPANKPALSGNGAFLAVASSVDAVSNDTNGLPDIYLFPISQGMINPSPTLISVDVSGNSSMGTSSEPSINNNGTVVAFTSDAALTGTTTPGINNVFARLSSNGGLAGGGVGSLNTGPVCIGRGRALAPDTIEISWGFGVHNDQLKGYTVEVLKLEGKDYKSVAKVPADGKAIYVDTGLTPSTLYTYRLWVSDPKGFAYTVDFSTKTKKVKKH